VGVNWSHEYIIFGSLQKLRYTMTDDIAAKLFLAPNQSIDRANSTRFLGLQIDDNLTWNSHLSTISRKIAKSIGILYKCRHYLDVPTLTNLYYSFIYSHISYGTLIWGSNYKTRLHKLQKRALRVITFSHARTPSRPLFQRLDILNIFEIAQLQLCEIVHKHLNNKLPQLYTNYFKNTSFVHDYHTRSRTNRNLFLPRPNLNYGKFGIKYAAVSYWNKIPLEIKNCETTSSFKKSFKRYLISLWVLLLWHDIILWTSTVPHFTYISSPIQPNLIFL